MKDPRWVDAKQMKTLEQFTCSLVTGIISLKTLESFQIAAYKLGLLNEDESETSKTICWEIKRLLLLYEKLFNQVLDRVPLEEAEILQGLSELAPKARKPRARNDQRQPISKTTN